ncbi:MAG: hypothetical protein KAQ63_02260 [Candidatus Moranbacteria bacterium]|nr:hypothetical protein [Candidatus Moranbacteria bacterium]
MNSIYVELKAGSSSRTVEKSLKSGNTYTFFVKEDFDSKNRSDLNDLVAELNVQLRKDGINSVEMRNIERELMRLEIGGRVDVRI